MKKPLTCAEAGRRARGIPKRLTESERARRRAAMADARAKRWVPKPPFPPEAKP